MLIVLIVTMLPAFKDYLNINPGDDSFFIRLEKYYCCQDVENILLNRECTETFSKSHLLERWGYPVFELVYLILTRIVPCMIFLQIFKFKVIKSHKKSSLASTLESDLIETSDKKMGYDESSGKTTNTS